MMGVEGPKLLHLWLDPNRIAVWHPPRITSTANPDCTADTGQLASLLTTSFAADIVCMLHLQHLLQCSVMHAGINTHHMGCSVMNLHACEHQHLQDSVGVYAVLAAVLFYLFISAVGPRCFACEAAALCAA
jgi:hypothetical protein